MKTLHTIFTNFAKRVALIITLLSTIGTTAVWAQTTTTYTFNSNNWGASPADWTSGAGGNQFSDDRGIQITKGASGANGTSPKSFTNVSQVVVTYSTNASSGAGSIAVKIGDNTAVSQSVTRTGGTTDRTLTYTFTPNQTGSVKVTVTCTTNSIYLKSVAITEAAASSTPTLSSIAVSGQTTEFTVGDAFEFDGTVTATYSDASTANVTDDATFSGYDMSEEGEQTVTVEYEGKTTTYNITVSAAAGGGDTGDCTWEETAISSIKSTDIVVITMTNTEGNTYAMSNNNGTGSAPTAVAVTVSGNTLTGEIADNIKWNISNSSGTLTIYPNGTTSTWLYSTTSNNGIRVGTSTSNNTFKIDTEYGYLYNIAQKRYVGVYNKSDWRSYTSMHDNIKNQTLKFYKQVCPVASYTVTYKANGGTGEDIVDDSASEIADCTFTRAGYQFTGWNTAADGSGDSYAVDDEVTSDITIYAQWEIINYSITYNLDGGTNHASNPTGYTIETETITLQTPSKTGYTFSGWYKESTFTNQVTQITKGSTGDITLYAKWTATPYTITYNLDGGTNHASNPTSYTIETETITLQEPSKTGHNFDGWYKESAFTNQVTQIAKGSTGDITLYAKWTEKALINYRTDCDACIPLPGYAEITGTYHFFPGETITLTVTPPTGINTTYTYQWQKKVNSDWENLTNETGQTYTKTNATTSDVGHYRCVVSADGYCDAIAEYNVKCLQLYVYYNDKTDAFNTPLTKVDATTATASVTLENANYTYYFKLTDGCENWYGYAGNIHSGWCTDVPMNANEHCALETMKYGTYVFNVNYSDLANLTVSVIYPSGNQDAGKVIYLDNNVLNWTHNAANAEGKNQIYYRIGRENHNSKHAMSLVPGTANLYKVTTAKYTDFEVWHIANNGCWSEGNSIYKTKTGDDWAATAATAFETLPVTSEAITVTPTTSIGNGGQDRNNNCEFYKYEIAEGMKKHTATVIPAPNGTITVSYTDHDGTAYSDFTSGDRNLAHTCLLTITATANEGYSLTSLTVNDVPFTSGNTHMLTEDAVITAEFTINTHTVTWKPAGGNWDGDASDIVQEYEYGAVIKAPEKPTYDCYEFVEWTPTYNAEMTMPDEDLVFTATWNKRSYTITFQNWDGSELQSSTVECGETPSYTGATPTREQTAQYSYTFSGWSPALYPADKDQEYTAQFNTSTRQYTVTWYDGTGNAHKTQTANYNATVALPTTNPNPCDDDYPHFIGWTADPIVGSTTIQPALVENVKVTGDCDYYAVFAKGEGGSSDYQKVTSALDDWSGEYLIVYETGNVAFNGGLSTLDANNNVIDVTINDNVIEASDETNSAKFTIAPYSTGYSIQSNSGKYIGETSYDNDLDESADTKYVNTISFSSGMVSIKGTGNSNGTYVALKYNNSSANRFRYYKSGQSDIALYKKGSGVNYTSYITTCCTSWTAPTLTYTTPLNAETSQTAQPQLGSGTTYGSPTYTSSNPSVLAVDEETGVVTAIGKGTATITVTWEGNEPYCSMSATSNTITVNGSYSVTFHSNGGTGTMEPQKADPSTQRIAKLNKNEFIKAGYVFVGWKDASGVAYTDEQENITLTKNITLFAQWAPVVTLNDAGSEETLNPTAVGGTVTLPNEGANACSPYEFVGWTSVAIADWNEGIEEPVLVASPYKPTAPITLYAVYKIQDEGNPNAFKLSFEGSNGKTYYVGEYGSSPYIRGYSNITKEEAVTFIRTKMYPNDDTRYYVYMEEKGEYLYYNGTFNSTSTPDENQGWIFHTVGDQIKLQSTYSYDPEYLSFSDRDNNTINMGTNASGSLFNMLPAVTSTYVAAPLCNQEITITFETGNGDFVANAPATNPLIVNQDETITLPTCEYPGYEFMGWLKDEQQEEPSDIPLTYYTGDYTVSGKSSSITFYAYYKAVPEEVEFTGTDDTELLMYYYDGANYYYASSFDGENGELPSMQNCFNATTWTFTNVGNMQYHIQDETGKYLGAVNDNDNDLSLSNTPKVWNFTLIDGLWQMICEDSPSRALMYNSEGKFFTNAAISNEGNGAYSYVTLGICPYPTYTTNPVLSQGFSITNTAMVTSASGQKVKATTALTLETRNIELPCTFTIAAPNITFYDNTGAEVTQLTSSAASEQFELHFAYKPTAENTMEYPTITITDDEMKTYTIKNRIYARSLPATFAIVAKVGNIWYALPSQGLNSTTPLAAYPVEVDDMADPTAVTAVPANADWSLRGVYEASRSDATKDRYVANGDNLVFVNNASPAMTLNASSSEEENYLLTGAQYNNYYSTNPGLYEWTPTTTDLETYQLTNEQRSRTLSVNTATVFGVHAQDKAVEQVRFLPITGRYIPAALQVVEWKENSVVIMYNGDPAQTAFVSVNGGKAQETVLSSAQRDIAVYELAANGLAANPTQRLSITIGAEKVILSIPYIISGAQTDLALLPGSTVAARQEVAKVSDLVILKDATLTADGAKSNLYKFRNVTIYGGGKLVIPSEAKGFGVASLTLRAGGITDAGEYDYVYPQFELRGTFTNSAAKINYDYITDYDHWFHLVLPFAGDLGTIKYPTEFYGANVNADNKGSWVIKRYAGEIRATGNYEAWKDIEEDNPKATQVIAGQGYIFWGAPKKVSVNGGDTQRQKWGIQRITMSVTAPNAMTAENGDKAISELSSYANVPNNSGKDNDQGWNLIGNPYMVNLTDMATTGLHACKLVEVIDPATGKWNGQWEWNDETDIRYLTIPSEHFDTYTAKKVDQAVPLVAGRAFFVQLEGEANAITFAAANRASLMPALRAANDKPVDIETGIILSNEILQDEVNFWIKDGKTNDYEYNADYPKTPNNNQFNIYGVHTNGDLSWVATGPEYAAESMPIGYQVPAAGTYILSLSEIYNSDGLDALYVTDHEMSPEVTVDIMSEPYEFSVNQAETNNERFTVSVRVKAKTENGATGLGNVGADGEQIHKFIYQDKMYILHHGVIYDATGKRVITINK